MPRTTKVSDPTIIIIPKQAKPQTDETRRRRRPRLLTVLLSVVGLIALIHFVAVIHEPNSVVSSSNCPGLIRSIDYTQVVHLQASSQEMGAVQFINQLVGGQPAALVQVTNGSSQNALDVYVFGCTIQQHNPKVRTLFTQRGLIQGTVTISAANTLVTSELDTTLPSQALSLEQPLQQNVYREYSWQNGMFVQVTYPSLYPVTSRSEAEALQQQANSGQSLPWSNPMMTAEQMAKDLFKWPTISPQDKLLNNDGTTARIELVQQNPQIQVTVTLKRLVQQNKTGLWFVTGAQTSGITLAQPQPSSVVTSPTTVKGAGAPVDGQTTATLFDHTLTALSLLNNPTLKADTSGSYTGMLFYTNSVQNQPGLLLVQSIAPGRSNKTGQLLLKQVILG
jgi:hypothetical protein